MKTIFVALLLVAVAHARSASKFAEGPACPIEDPLTRPGGEFNVTLDPIVVINEGGVRGELNVIGLTSLHYVYDINVITLNVDLELTLGNLDLTMLDVDCSGWIDASPLTSAVFPSGDFVGKGTAKLVASEVSLKLTATLFPNLITNKLSIRLLGVSELVFGSLSVDLGAGFLVDETPVDWAAWSAGIKDAWDTEFAANHDVMVEKARNAANNVIGNYTLDELLELIEGIGGGEEGCPTAAPRV